MQLTLKDDLPFVSITMAHRGNDAIIDDVLVDTGSASTILAADAVAAVGIVPELSDILSLIRGVGGVETVYSRRIQAPGIDVLQRAVSLWESGDRAGLARFLVEAAFGREDQVRLGAQTLVNVLPDDDAERRLLEGFLAGQELLAEQSRQERLL